MEHKREKKWTVKSGEEDVCCEKYNRRIKNAMKMRSERKRDVTSS